MEHDAILCDRTKIREILLNIISNSIKYTPEGGKISVKIEETPAPRKGFASYRITVKDNGIGMSKEYLPHIFEEFTREHSSTESHITGTGLGLPIVKSLVNLMGGTIDVESELGAGTITTVSRLDFRPKNSLRLTSIKTRFSGSPCRRFPKNACCLPRIMT